MKFPLFAIPGMSTDSRILAKLDLGEFNTIEWLEPGVDEDIKSYSLRMAAQIPEKQACNLIGLSLGGLVAQEICQLRKIKGLVLISTIKSQNELPGRLTIQKHLPLYKLSSGAWRIKSLPVWGPLAGIHKKEEITLLQSMFSSFSDHYRFWAIEQLIHWKGVPSLPTYLHLHGKKDPLFPARHIDNATIIPKADHFMVYQKAGILSPLIQNFLEY